MDVDEAVAFAFDAGLKVRGGAALDAARVSLALHASRTVDAAPFLARDGALAQRAVDALLSKGRPDLGLQVALWAHDARPEAEVAGALRRATSAYASATRWAAGEGGGANLAWIRDVPRPPAEREALAQRLLLLSRTPRPLRERLAAAALEAELAELPRPAAFGTILQAAAAGRTPEVVERTLDGLQVLDPSADAPEARVLLARLRGALEAQRAEGAGRPLEETVASFLAGASPASAPVLAVVGAHLAAACARAGAPTRGLEVVEAMLARVRAATPLRRDSEAALLIVRGALPGGENADPLALPAARRPSADEFVAGACEAARALQSGVPALRAMRLFDPEDLGIVLPDPGSVRLVKELMREGAHGAAAAGDLATLAALFERLRRLGLRPQWDLYLRALLCDAAGEAAARQHSAKAWALALSIAGPGVPRFERAKLRGRAACAFIRAAETSAGRAPLVDLYFASPAPERGKATGQDS